MTPRLGDPCRIGNTVWTGYVEAVTPGIEVLVRYPDGQHHDGARCVYDVALFTVQNKAGEWVMGPATATKEWKT